MENNLKHHKAKKRANLAFYCIAIYATLLLIVALTASSMSFFWNDLFIQLLIILTFALPFIVLTLAILSLILHQTTRAKFLIAFSVLIIFILSWMVYELSKMCIIC